MLIDLLLLLLAVTGAGVALSRQPVRQVMALAVNGLVMTLLFMALQAPDVALSQLAVGAAVVPLMVLLAERKLRRTRARKDRR